MVLPQTTAVSCQKRSNSTKYPKVTHNRWWPHPLWPMPLVPTNMQEETLLHLMNPTKNQYTGQASTTTLTSFLCAKDAKMCSHPTTNHQNHHISEVTRTIPRSGTQLLDALWLAWHHSQGHNTITHVSPHKSTTTIILPYRSAWHPWSDQGPQFKAKLFQDFSISIYVLSDSQ